VESVVRVDRCPCGSRDLSPPARPFRIGDVRFGLRRCRRCRRVLLDPRPAPGEIPACYSDGYYGAGSRKFIPPIEHVVDRFRDHRAALAARLLTGIQNAGNGRVLDIGCGGGQFLARLIRSGYLGHGTELSPETGIRAAQVPGLNLHLGALEAGTYAPGAFDLISIWHVLEHLPDPDLALRYCNRWLAPGGLLLTAVPNTGSWQAAIFGGSWFHLDPPRHLHHFDRASLTAMLAGAGFRVERIRTFSWEQNPYGILQSALNALGFPRDEFYEVLKGNRSLARPRLVAELALMMGLFPAALLLGALEALFGRGGTLEIVGRRIEAPRALTPLGGRG
jgi:2-polyprenyl-3-methyl-5-hydroxy-6-metoxy-1,4-benzoquinol methylase